MRSVYEIYRIGHGPSSSHTMGPRKAAEFFLKGHAAAAEFRVTLYGSLAATGKGHLTHLAITEVLQEKAPVEICWKPDVVLPLHPNGMKFEALDNRGCTTGEWTVFSIGGGALMGEDRKIIDTTPVPVHEYELETMTEILHWCERTGKSYWEYVFEHEDENLYDYLREVWTTMQDAVCRGLETEGVLPGPLNLRRKAPTYYIKAMGYKQSVQTRALVFSYALAVSEENAGGGKIVTAPTCGSCGVLPAVLYHLQKKYNLSENAVLSALAAAGMVGNVVKHNASVSGAEAGCQAEIGTATCMAAAAVCRLYGYSLEETEYAAEIALEHQLGLTCDPVGGLVQIPCIERNAVAAMRALDAAELAHVLHGTRKISFDTIVQTMYETGKDLSERYRETSEGGLAVTYRGC